VSLFLVTADSITSTLQLLGSLGAMLE
jgi:hypothetical protein